MIRMFHICGPFEARIVHLAKSETSKRLGNLAYIFMIESYLTCSVVHRAQLSTYLACICLETLKCSYLYIRSSNV